MGHSLLCKGIKNRIGTLIGQKVVIEDAQKTTGALKSPTPIYDKEKKEMISGVYKIIRCQCDVRIDRGMDESAIKSKALECGNADDVCACDSEENGFKTLASFKNSLSCFTSSSNRYANVTVYWLVKQEEDGEIEFIETADWE